MYKKITTVIAMAFLMSALIVPTAFAASNADTGISQSISNELGRNSGIRVLTNDGTVYLRGNVGHVSTISKAVEIAQSTPGVNKVVNQLNVYVN